MKALRSALGRFEAKVFAALFALWLMSACKGIQPASSEAPRAPQSARQVEAFSPSSLVCNPLTEGSGTDTDPVEPSAGIRGRLFSIPNWETCLWARNCLQIPVDGFLAEGTDLGMNLFFQDINVPTRLFTAGFETQSGEVIRNPQGEVVYEWFGLDLQAQIKLGPNDPAGQYQFALISDDGVILDLDTTGQGLQPAIQDPLIHAPKLSCASQTVTLSAASKIPMRLRYFQGPRFHIALQLLWRLNPTTLQTSHCGEQGTHLYHNPDTTPSTPQAAYEQLLSEGWRPLGPENFELPSSSGNNPCGPIGGGIGI
ncbi:MAG: hypothetical protein ACK5QT_06815 [Oligoflexia bacterium]